MPRTIIFLILSLSCSLGYAQNKEIDQSVTIPINKIDGVKERTLSLEKEIGESKERILSLEKEIGESKENLSQINKSIDQSQSLHKDIQSSISKIVELIKKHHKLDPITLEIIQPTNWYIFALPATTMIIVIFGTFLSIRTITIKSEESLKALGDSNRNQFEINQANINANKERNQESIISRNRQRWINTLRDDIASFLSKLTKCYAMKEAGKDEIISEMWLEYYKIHLLLNPNEDDHVHLTSLIRTTLGSVKEIGTDDFVDKTDEILEASEKILKREWNRVKSFD